jgi:hypothetical protein
MIRHRWAAWQQSAFLATTLVVIGIMWLVADPVSVPGRGFDYVLMPLAPVLLVLPANASVDLFNSVVLRRSPRQLLERALFLGAAATWVVAMGLAGGLAITDPDVSTGMLVRNGALATSSVLAAAAVGVHQAVAVAVLFYATASWVLGTNNLEPPDTWAVLFRPVPETPWAAALVGACAAVFLLAGSLRRLACHVPGAPRRGHAGPGSPDG